jgi:hypothetical protein
MNRNPKRWVSGDEPQTIYGRFPSYPLGGRSFSLFKVIQKEIHRQEIVTQDAG